MHRADMRITEAEAPTLARLLGLTHVVLGEVTGTEASCKLALRLLAGEGLKPLGEPVVLTGALADVTGKLPDAAVELCRRLGLPQPPRPKIVETPSDLQFLGGLGWAPLREVRPMQIIRLETLAERSSLARLLATQRLSLIHDSPYESAKFRHIDIMQSANQLMQLGGDNALAFAGAALALEEPGWDLQLCPSAANLKSYLDRFPNNFLFNSAAQSLAAGTRDYEGAVKAAEKSVRSATRYYWAWAKLGNAIQAKGQSLRRSRLAGQITQEEWATLSRLYADELTIRKHAVEVDPSDSDSWVALSSTAAMAGESRLAEEALWKGVSLNPASGYAFYWGMELYEPKWLGDDRKRAHLERMAAKASYRTSGERLALARYFHEHLLPEFAAAVLKTPAERAEFNEWARSNTLRIASSPPPPKPGRPRPGPAPDAPQRLYCHTDAVRSVAWSPDGARLASGGNDTLVKVWTVTGGRPQLQQLNGHTDSVTWVAWRPDGKALASAGEDKTVRIWDLQGMKEPQVLTEHTGKVRCVAWSPDGQVLASASDDGTARLWDAGTGRVLHVLTGHPERVYRVLFSPDGRLVATTTPWENKGTGMVRLWDVATGKLQRSLTQLPGTLFATVWSPDGTRLATADSSRRVRIWDVETGRETRALHGGTGFPASLAWSGDSRLLAAGSTDRRIYVWDAASGELRRELTGHADAVRSLSWDGSHQRLASGGDDLNVLLWDMKAASGPGPAAGTGNKPGAEVKPIAAGPEILSPGSLPGPVMALAFAPDGRKLAISTTGGLTLHDAQTGRLLRRLEEAQRLVVGLAFSRDSKEVAAASSAGLTTWDVESGTVKWTWTEDRDLLGPVCYSRDGRVIAAASRLGGIRVWEARGGRLLQSLQVDGQLRSVALSEDGSRLLYGNGLIFRLGLVTLWDLPTGKRLRVFEGHTDLVEALAVAPGGLLAASASLDGVVKLWSLPAGKLLGTLRGHESAVRALTFSPDGKWLASSSDDRTVRLWDVAQRRAAQVIDLNQRPVGLLGWSPDGKTLMVGGGGKQDGTEPELWRWRLP
jgi:WD40 repeat protein